MPDENVQPSLPPAVSGAAPASRPAGWWSMPGNKFDGSREGVVKAVGLAEGVPDEDKEYIAAKIGKFPVAINYVTIHAFVCSDTTSDGKQTNWKADYSIIGYVVL